MKHLPAKAMLEGEPRDLSGSPHRARAHAAHVAALYVRCGAADRAATWVPAADFDPQSERRVEAICQGARAQVCRLKVGESPGEFDQTNGMNTYTTVNTWRPMWRHRNLEEETTLRPPTRADRTRLRRCRPSRGPTRRLRNLADGIIIIDFLTCEMSPQRRAAARAPRALRWAF